MLDILEIHGIQAVYQESLYMYIYIYITTCF